jgi:hypothetical protein
MSAEPDGGAELEAEGAALEFDPELALGLSFELGGGAPGSITIWAALPREAAAEARAIEPSLSRSRRFKMGLLRI